ncbi:MAG: class I SAM-dependent methyltransferase [Actinomycetota bacterium]|nr:class I SAM-dependent methyltransferase [Actinomycetota bacterium]
MLQKQTLASFDYQWRELTEGGALLTDDWFTRNVDRIISEELLCLDPAWFRGKRVLDAGSGNGRWTVGLLRLGCEVVAVDASMHALERLNESVQELVPESRARLATDTVDLLDLPAYLASERFDLVFSFGVLHHTGNTRPALRNVASLVADDGVLSLYLYGQRSFTRRGRAALELQRLALAPLPFDLKRRLIAKRRGTDVHQAFDELSPMINTRHRFEDVRSWLQDMGFSAVERTIEHSELFIRAQREGTTLEGFELPRPLPPYWFERYGTVAREATDA